MRLSRFYRASSGVEAIYAGLVTWTGLVYGCYEFWLDWLGTDETDAYCPLGYEDWVCELEPYAEEFVGIVGKEGVVVTVCGWVDGVVEATGVEEVDVAGVEEFEVVGVEEVDVVGVEEVEVVGVEEVDVVGVEEVDVDEPDAVEVVGVDAGV